MVFNGTELVDNPWNTTFSPFTDLFSRIAGAGFLFWLIPISFIGVALWVKTRELGMVSMYLIGTGAFFTSAGIFIGAMDMAMVFTVVAAIGIGGLFISIFYKR